MAMASEVPATWMERPATQWRPSSATSARSGLMASSIPQRLRRLRNCLRRVSARNPHHLLSRELFRGASWLENDAGIAQILIAINKIDLPYLDQPPTVLLDQ